MASPNRGRRKAIPAMVGLDRGPVCVTNLMVSVQGGSIVLDPQVTGACVMSLDEEGATTLCNILSVWLG